jgi:hypothetical protein
LDRLLLAPEFGHPFAELFQLHQAFLIGVQKFVDLQFGAFPADVDRARPESTLAFPADS